MNMETIMENDLFKNEFLYRIYLAKTEGGIFGGAIDLIKAMNKTVPCRDCE